jgi:iron complex outermembrane receptor protein
MHLLTRAALVLLSPLALTAQQPARPDSVRRAITDSSRADRLGAVTVTATPARRDQPASATHLSSATVGMTPAMNIYDLLRQAGGLEVHDQGQGPGFASNASVRGFSSDHSTDLALWIDGVPVNEPINGHAEGYNDFTLLFPGAVRDIDVIRGPTSALYGNFALAGVVNVRTMERMQGSTLTAAGGSFGRGDLLFLTGYDHGANGGGVVGARYAHEDGFRPNGGSDLGQGHARFVRELRSGMTLDGGIEAYSAHWKSSGFLSEEEFAAHDYGIVSNPADGGFHQRVQERVSLRVLTNRLLWRSTAYATQGRWQLFLTIPPEGGRFEGTGSQTEEEDGRHGYGVTTAVTWAGPNRELTVGGEGRWDRADYDNFFTTARNRDSAQVLLSARQLAGALFVQSHADVSPRLRFDLGARVDGIATRTTLRSEGSGGEVSASHAVVTPKLGAVVRLTPVLRGYANVSRGFRSTDGVIEDPRLAPITAWAYETGAKFDRNDFSASAALFLMDVSNEQTLDPLTGDASNGGSSRRQGLELALHAPLSPVTSVTAQWTFLDAKYGSITAEPEDGGGPPEVLDGLQVYNTASYIGSAAFDVAPAAGNWRIRIAGNWVGAYAPFDEPGVLLGAYGLLHLSGSTRLMGAEWTLGVRNVLDRAYPELVAGHIVAPGQPRAISLAARVAF